MTMNRNTSIGDIVSLCGSTAKASGWHEDAPDPTLTPGDHRYWVMAKIMLTVTELSEAVEHVRKRDIDQVWEEEDGKPDGFPVEIADAIIRLFDLWWALDDQGFDMPDLGKTVYEKVRFNASRGARHGKLA